MVRYRRNRVSGASYFFTVTLADRRNDVLVRHIDLLREAFRRALSERPFHIDAIVVLPEHLHSIWTMPVDDSDYPARWHRIKATFTRFVQQAGVPLHSSRHGTFDLWQPRYWEHTLRNDDDVARHIDYIHYNPVKHGHVKRAVEWPYSSFHRYVAQGIYRADWGLAADIDLAAGERSRVPPGLQASHADDT